MNKDTLISFAGGGMYGLVTVAVGQPLDTIKTRMQARPENLRSSMAGTGLELFKKEGIPGLYRGGMPLVFGGVFMRSAQFGFYKGAMQALGANRPDYVKPEKVLGVIDPHVTLAGFCGGLGRGLVEGPAEYIKVRTQVVQQWSFLKMYQGCGITMLRNSGLFTAFVIYIDISKQLVEGGLTPFLEGAICANLAWMTIWPLDIVKSQIQSGNYKGVGIGKLLSDIVSSGRLFRGLLPGLARSTVANGSGMVALKKTEEYLRETFPDDEAQM